MASSVPLNGYLYVANNPEHRREAVTSVRSLRKADPTAHATLVTDRRFEKVWDEFDRCVLLDKIAPKFGSKVQCISTEYYLNTLYLDTDTYICEDPSGLFALTEWFDVCATSDPAEVVVLHQPGLVPYNTGVVLLGPCADKFLAEWRRFYFDETELTKVLKGHPAKTENTDQPSFLQALMHTGVKFLALPSTWNARYRFNTSFTGSVNIIHGNVIDYEALRKEMNATRVNRVWKAK